jgi:hypothetical protein
MSTSRMRTIVLCAFVVAGAAGWIVTNWLRTRNDSMFRSGQIEKDDWVLQQGTLDVFAFVALTAIVVAVVWLLIRFAIGRKQR